jgi:hypothetical protein
LVAFNQVRKEYQMSELAQEIQAIVEAEQPKTQEVTTETVTPETTETPSVADEKKEEAAASKTFTEDEVKAQLDAEAAKIRNKYERKMERLRIESETRTKILNEQQQQVVEASEKPKEEDYADFASYLEALAEFKADEMLTKRESAKRQQEAEKAQVASVERESELRRSLMESGENKYDDFEDVVKNSPLRIADPAYLAILESDISAELVYHLAKNSDDAKRISEMSPYAQAKEIGKLEDKLTAKSIKKSDAPKPISPVNGSKDFTKRYEDMTIAEIEADAVKRGARWA